MPHYDVEITDTFGGEANYSWVRRHVIEAPKNATTRQLVTLAKAAQGWTGIRCNTTSYGDTIDVRPRGACLVMFIAWRDTSLNPLPETQE